ncbi:hypothetical protein DPEC_G00094770 [Dallia pectoralis]|uniref:Uncharacterized protein n=1 Tax=Dallia pectoralis TaxID=75939 RepID=A0ACC2H1U7_DALPE|nr:hypothetical protein DPEC_G00094770 [Dallia pectoralis]
MVVDYNLLEGLLSNPVDRLKIVHWLEETNHVVTNKKSVQEIASQVLAGQRTPGPPEQQQESIESNDSQTQGDTGKRHTTFITEKTIPAECTTVLHVAKFKFLEVFRKANESLPLSSEEHRWYLYYLEALFILKHMQRPAFVKNMTVEEWCQRKVEMTKNGRMAVIGVKEHKTGAQDVANICLDEEEENWMDTYYRHTRPVFLRNSDPEIDDESDRFFISSSGLPLYNPSNDVRIFQKRNNVLIVSSRQAQKGLEMSSFSDAQKGLVADHLSHSTATAEKHHQLKTTETATLGNERISDIINPTE